MPEKIELDIVALKESEERFRMIAERSTVGIFLYQGENFIYVNPAMERLTGYSADELLAMKMWEHVHENFRNLLKQRGLARQRGESIPADYELKYITKGGDEGWVLLSAARAEYKGHPVGIGTVIDISERKRMEEKLKEVQEELVRKEKLAMLGTIAAGMGNELRNPLGVMNNAVYFLKTILPDPDDTIKEYLDIIASEISNSEHIINDLLDSVRIRTPRKKPVTAGELVEKSLGKCLVPQNVSVEVDIPESVPAVNVDQFQMGQVFQNIISNALQAMPEGGTLSIAARQLPGVGDREDMIGEGTVDFRYPISGFVEITVSDTGEGISPENMEKLFQPLFTTKARGIGLGLVVCKNLIEANGGKIEVTSELGKGTTFTVILPVQGGD